MLGLAIRLVVAAALPLTEDEAYYRLWAQAPAFGYYDHPPMIAWWIWAGIRLAGDSSLGVRIVPVVGCAVTSLLVRRLAWLSGTGVAGADTAGIFYNVMPLVAAGGLLAVPDAPASLLWTATLVCAFEAFVGRGLRWWLAAGVTAGLACLSKYSALFLAPGVLLWLTASREGRRRLSSPGPWLAALVATALFSLNVFWNAGHHWATAARQFGRIAPHAFAPRFLAEFLLGQFLLLNPLVAVLAAQSLAGPPGAGDGRGRLALAATSAPFLCYLLVHSLHDRVEAHWTAPLYPAIAVLAALAPGLAKRWLWAAPSLGLALVSLAAALALAPPRMLPVRRDPATALRDWPAFSGAVEARRQASGASWIGTLSYGLAGQLAAGAHVRAPVVEVRERDRFQGLVAPNVAQMSGPGLIVDLPRRLAAVRLDRCFASVAEQPGLWRGKPDEGGIAYGVVRVEGPPPGFPDRGC